MVRRAVLLRLLVANVVGVILAILVRALYKTYFTGRRTGGDLKRARIDAKSPASRPVDRFVASVVEAAQGVTAASAAEWFPRKYEVHGHVVVVRLNEGCTEDQFAPLARHFAECFSPIVVDVVLVDVGGIAGELRRPQWHELYVAATVPYPAEAARQLEKMWGDSSVRNGGEDGASLSIGSRAELQDLLSTYLRSSSFTLHIEGGTKYCFDPRLVMFSSGNTTERMHFATVKAEGETVVDMFCGIGYFSIPLAKCGKARAIHTIDKNNDSISFIKVNAVLNKVDHLIHPVCGDCRVAGEELVGTCDRVLMGLIPTCREFLPRAVSFLKTGEDGAPRGTIHYHFLADKHMGKEVALAEVLAALGEAAAERVTLVAVRRVKSYAPKRFHFVADLVWE